MVDNINLHYPDKVSSPEQQQYREDLAKTLSTNPAIDKVEKLSTKNPAENLIESTQDTVSSILANDDFTPS